MTGHRHSHFPLYNNILHPYILVPPAKMEHYPASTLQQDDRGAGRTVTHPCKHTRTQNDSTEPVIFSPVQSRITSLQPRSPCQNEALPCLYPAAGRQGARPKGTQVKVQKGQPRSRRRRRWWWWWSSAALLTCCEVEGRALPPRGVPGVHVLRRDELLHPHQVAVPAGLEELSQRVVPRDFVLRGQSGPPSSHCAIVTNPLRPRYRTHRCIYPFSTFSSGKGTLIIKHLTGNYK